MNTKKGFTIQIYKHMPRKTNENKKLKYTSLTYKLKNLFRCF